MNHEKLPKSVLPILLAGGEGTRLYPITADLPKPLIPVDGVPAVCRILDTLAARGADRAVITVRYRADDIIGLLGDDYHGIRLFYSREDTPRGTAGGVRDAWDAYADDTDTDALIISGDAVFTCDLSAFAAFHRETDAAASILCVTVDDPGAFGTVMHDKNGCITGFSEKPCAAQTLSDTVSCGIYCMRRDFLARIPPDGTPDFGQDILPQALSEGMALYAYVSGDFWCDIGTFSDYLSCSLAISAGRIAGTDTPRSRPHLPPHISDSSVGHGCFIPSSASVRQSILFDGVTVGGGASVTSSIVCRGVKIGDGAVIEAGCVIGGGCIIGDRCRLPRGTRLQPGTVLQTKPTAARDAFDGSAVLGDYLSEVGYALSASAVPSPERAVIFARAIAAFAEKTGCSLFLCHAEDTPAVRCAEALVYETLCCIGTPKAPLAVCRADGVLPLSAARMPYLPLPTRSSDCEVFRVVFLRHGGVPCAAVFDDTGLHPTRQSERMLDACLTDAAAAGDSPPVGQPTAEPQLCRVSAADLCAAYIRRYAAGHLPHADGMPFTFSCGTSPAERLLADLLCAMGGEEKIRAPLHFSVAEPWEDCGDILCPLTVSDLRMTPVGTYSHWTLLSLLAASRRSDAPTTHAFPTPRTAADLPPHPPLSVPVCAPEALHADYRYTNTPAVSAHAAAHDPALLARRCAAMEAEDAVLLARDIALFCAQTTQPLGKRITAAQMPPSCRRHGFAPPQSVPLYAAIRRLTGEDGLQAFSPAVEGVVLRRADGLVRVVATRDRSCRIIADASTAEAAEELFRYARGRLLSVLPEDNKR